MFTSWKTSLTGVVAIIIAGLVQLNYISAATGATISGVLLGVLGLLSKDNDVTGGKREQ